MAAIPKILRHGHARLRTPTYLSWKNMMGRCFCEGAPYFKYYGGRGITVCERWRSSYLNFLADMGERPPGATLDRIDGDGHYEPGNCRWSTMREQVRNRRYTKLNPRGVRQIRWLIEMGYRQVAVARMFGVRSNVIWNVVHGVHWSDV